MIFGIDLTLAFVADVRRRWAASHGYLSGSVRINVHDRVGSVACGPLDSGVTIWVTADDFCGVLEALVTRMLSDLGERGDYSAALEASIDAARARREAEVRESGEVQT